MTLDERLENVAVIGAAGKMGSGIAVMIAQEMAKLKLKPENSDKVYRLYLIDINEKALDGLRSYMKTQLTKVAEKSTVALRGLYAAREDLVENRQVIDAFVADISHTKLVYEITHLNFAVTLLWHELTYFLVFLKKK